ncbi:hypothetical protein Tco_1316228 [Tanacetum coccineum]
MIGSRQSRDMTKYFHFHKDLRHDTNQCRELRHHIKEAIRSGQLAHLVKGIKKRKAKTLYTQSGEGKMYDKDIVQVEAYILMINRKTPISKRKYSEEPIDGIAEITFPPVSGFNNSSNSVIIKLNLSIKVLRVDSKILLVGFSGEHSWPLEEVSLEVTIGERSYTRTKTLNFVIVRSGSPHNLLLRRTAMQKMGIVVSTIHRAIKFYTLYGIGTVPSTYESSKVKEG